MEKALFQCDALLLAAVANLRRESSQRAVGGRLAQAVELAVVDMGTSLDSSESAGDVHRWALLGARASPDEARRDEALTMRAALVALLVMRGVDNVPGYPCLLRRVLTCLDRLVDVTWTARDTAQSVGGALIMLLMTECMGEDKDEKKEEEKEQWIREESRAVAMRAVQREHTGSFLASCAMDVLEWIEANRDMALSDLTNRFAIDCVKPPPGTLVQCIGDLETRLGPLRLILGGSETEPCAADLPEHLRLALAAILYAYVWSCINK